MTRAHRRWQQLAWVVVTAGMAAVLALSWPPGSAPPVNAPWPSGLAPPDYGVKR